MVQLRCQQGKEQKAEQLKRKEDKKMYTSTRKTKAELIKMIEVEILKAKAKNENFVKIPLGCKTTLVDTQDLVVLYEDSNEFDFVTYRINKYGNPIIYIIF